MRNSATNFEIGGAKFHIKRAISEMGRAKFREILISGAQFANFPVWALLTCWDILLGEHQMVCGVK